MRPSFHAEAAAIAVAAIGLSACRSAPSASPDAGPSVARTTAPSSMASATPAGPATSAVPYSAAGARGGHDGVGRAVSLQGDAHVVDDVDGGSGRALAVQSEIPESDWIALGSGARLAAKDPRTSREAVFVGPGRARLCVGRREESWLASGVFESEPGAGESPGGEEWVVTPLGILRFSAAKLRLEVAGVGAAHATARVGDGTVFAWIAPDVRADGLDAGAGAHAGGAWERVTNASFRLSLASGQAPVEAARAAVDRCETIAHRAEELTRALLAPRAASDAGGPSTFGSIIVEQVSTRELARAACAVAEVRTGALTKDRGRTMDDLEERLRSAAKAWTALPVAAVPALAPAPPNAP